MEQPLTLLKSMPHTLTEAQFCQRLIARKNAAQAVDGGDVERNFVV